MFSSKIMMRLAFLCIILLVSSAISHERKTDNDHNHDHHHDHDHGHEHEKTYMDEAKDVASASIHMMIKAALFSAISFIVKWSVYIAIAGAVIWYFVTHRGAAQGTQGAAGHGHGHARSD